MGIDYPGLILTSIILRLPDGKKFEDLQDGDEVVFTEADHNGSKAAFLRDIRQDMSKSDVSREREFKAKFVSPETAAEMARRGFGQDSTEEESIPLFCVHGFNSEPGLFLSFFQNERDALNRFSACGKKYYPVPVLWPCSSKDWKSSLGYGVDQYTHSQDAGKGLQAFVGGVSNETFPRKSLLLHSMGNHVVFNGACAAGVPDVQFENIFMVAADLPYDIFHEHPDEDYSNDMKREVFKDKRLKAERFFEMLAKGPDGKPMGKIHVLFNRNDSALHASSWLANYESRLGNVGTGACRCFWLKDSDQGGKDKPSLNLMGQHLDRMWKEVEKYVAGNGVKKLLVNQAWYNDEDQYVREDLKRYIESWDVTHKCEYGFHGYMFETWAIEYYGTKSLSASGKSNAVKGEGVEVTVADEDDLIFDDEGCVIDRSARVLFEV